MKTVNKILIILLNVLMPPLCAALAHQKNNEYGALFVIISKGVPTQCLIKGTVENFAIRLMHRAKSNHESSKGIPQEIGTATCQYLSKNKEASIKLLTINPEYQKSGLGKFLFKYTIAILSHNFSPQGIEWTAFPLPSGKMNLKQLVSFYTNLGALDITKDKTYSTEMAYDTHAAHMVATLLPIFEPTIKKKEDNEIMLRGKKINTSPYDIIGTIAQYIGNTSEQEG